MTAVAEAAYVPVAAVAEVPEGTARSVSVAGREVAVVNHGGWFFALGGRCTHAAAPLGEGAVAAGCLLVCPWHGAVFDVRTGRVRRGPARKPLQTFPVRVEDGVVLVAVPAAVAVSGRGGGTVPAAAGPAVPDTRSAPCPSL